MYVWRGGRRGRWRRSTATSMSYTNLPFFVCVIILYSVEKWFIFASYVEKWSAITFCSHVIRINRLLFFYSVVAITSKRKVNAYNSIYHQNGAYKWFCTWTFVWHVIDTAHTFHRLFYCNVVVSILACNQINFLRRILRPKLGFDICVEKNMASNVKIPLNLRSGLLRLWFWLTASVDCDPWYTCISIEMY